MTHVPMTHDPAQGNPVLGQLVPVNFRQDTLFAVQMEDGEFVAIKPICDSLGLKWYGQFERLNRDEILSEGIRVIRIPSPSGSQETVCLRLQLVNGWLLTIDDARLKDPTVRERVLTYKRECYDVLFQHFYGHRNAPGDEAREGNAPKVKMVTEVRHTFGVLAAKHLWVKLQLPVVPAMIEPLGQGDLFSDPGKKAA